MTNVSVEITAGRLLWGEVRDMVSRMQFDGHEVSIWESSGFFTRDFVIKGSEKSLRKVKDIFEDYIERVEERKQKRK
jgi:translation elongation factor EF-Tu-like GTPase